MNGLAVPDGHVGETGNGSVADHSVARPTRRTWTEHTGRRLNLVGRVTVRRDCAPGDLSPGAQS